MIELDVKAIHPSRGAKYSPNLYKWLTQREHRSTTSRVFRDATGALWIGMRDEGPYLIGCRLLHVLGNGSKARSGAYALKEIGPLEEIADFWARYAVNGRCAIDPEHQRHFVGDATRWREFCGGRECQWCGNVRQRLEHYLRTTGHDRWAMAPQDPTL